MCVLHGQTCCGKIHWLRPKHGSDPSFVGSQAWPWLCNCANTRKQWHQNSSCNTQKWLGRIICSQCFLCRAIGRLTTAHFQIVPRFSTNHTVPTGPACHVARFRHHVAASTRSIPLFSASVTDYDCTYSVAQTLTPVKTSAMLRPGCPWSSKFGRPARAVSPLNFAGTDSQFHGVFRPFFLGGGPACDSAEKSAWKKIRHKSFHHKSCEQDWTRNSTAPKG